jgi:hypothetical protein
MKELGEAIITNNSNVVAVPELFTNCVIGVWLHIPYAVKFMASAF